MIGDGEDSGLSVQPDLDSQAIQIQGVDVPGDAEGSEAPAHSDLDSFAASDSNGGSALPENLSEFESTGSNESLEDVPALDEQVVAAEQDFQEQESNGLGEPDVAVAEDCGDVNGSQEEVPPII